MFGRRWDGRNGSFGRNEVHFVVYLSADLPPNLVDHVCDVKPPSYCSPQKSDVFHTPSCSTASWEALTLTVPSCTFALKASIFLSSFQHAMQPFLKSMQWLRAHLYYALTPCRSFLKVTFEQCVWCVLLFVPCSNADVHMLHKLLSELPHAWVFCTWRPCLLCLGPSAGCLLTLTEFGWI